MAVHPNQAARYRALNRLREKYPDQFERFYAIERAKTADQYPHVRVYGVNKKERAKILALALELRRQGFTIRRTAERIGKSYGFTWNLLNENKGTVNGSKDAKTESA